MSTETEGLKLQDLIDPTSISSDAVFGAAALEMADAYLCRRWSSAESVPAAVRIGVGRLARWLALDSEAPDLSPHPVKSESVLDSSVTYDTSRPVGSLPPSVEDLLKPYRLSPGL